jgi:hypothetical protein
LEFVDVSVVVYVEQVDLFAPHVHQHFGTSRIEGYVSDGQLAAHDLSVLPGQVSCSVVLNALAVLGFRRRFL